MLEVHDGRLLAEKNRLAGAGDSPDLLRPRGDLFAYVLLMNVELADPRTYGRQGLRAIAESGVRSVPRIDGRTSEHALQL